MTATQPYGTWSSPISAEMLAEAGAKLSDLVVDGTDLLWLRSRPNEGGRYAIMRRTADGTVAEVSPAGFNARTRVGEYGGGALAAGAGVILASSWDDQRVHLIDPAARTATPVTADPAVRAGRRWAQMQIDPTGSWFVAVRETHGDERPQGWSTEAPDEARNEVVHVDLADGTETVLVSGRDFVGGPWLDPFGHRLAWLAWDHPEMPWDAAELWVGTLSTDGRSLTAVEHVAGGLTPDGPARATSVSEATWHPDGSLIFSHDPDGWWNLYAWDADGARELLPAAQVDRGMVRWVHGNQRLTVTDDSLIATVASEAGLLHVEAVDRGRLTGPDVTFIAGLVAFGPQLALVHGGPATLESLSLLDPDTGDWSLVTTTGDAAAMADFVVAPEPMTFPTAGGEQAHALYYRPHNPAVVGPDDERPPLVVMTHGGPTGAALPSLSPGKLFWTSRGFAVVDVNYRGSAGYGRAYRDALRGRWGISDIEDVVAAAAHLAETGRADPDRTVIRGGSAGGYTTLMALCVTDVFAAGCSYFGVSDLGALASDTHKFESRYLDGLVGRWPDEREIYDQRSPINRTATLVTPMLVLQGDEDEVVPPRQAEIMVEALAAKGVTHAYLLFEGEQHGFRKAEHIIRAAEAELAFYGHILGFQTQPMIDLPLR